MNHKNQKTDSSAAGDVLQDHIGPFMAELRAAGYANRTLGAKRVSLEQFTRW